MLFLRSFLIILISAGALHAAPSSVADFAAKAERHEPLSVVFFGGSLTFGANASDPQTTSFRALTMKWLQEKYPDTPLTFHDAAIGGTGSQLGMFRTGRDVLKYHPDLVFLDFTANDDPEGTDVQALASYERIVRELLESNAAVMPVLTMFRWHAQKPDAPEPPRHEAHLKLAAAYGLSPANVLDYVRAKVKSGTQPGDLWNMGDGAHPGDEGYQLFFEAIRDCYERSTAARTPVVIPAATVFENLYPRHTRTRLVDALPKTWTRQKTYRTALWFDGLSSRWMDDVAVASAKDRSAPLEMEFEGSMIAIFGERNGLTPAVKISIDGRQIENGSAKPPEPVWELNTQRFAPPKKGTGNLFLWQVLARDLPDGKHTLRIEPLFEGADKDSDLRIESICTAGH